ncbi:hypothetical protein QM327_23290, partial [Pantoea dispersa]|uniref:hypothetical protein n=1 Tax=Pantoea dispersa TaxID=59814 RepID=UPI00241D20FD
SYLNAHLDIHINAPRLNGIACLTPLSCVSHDKSPAFCLSLLSARSYDASHDFCRKPGYHRRNLLRRKMAAK